MASPHTISVPWDAQILREYNGRHPLPISLIKDTPEFKFTSQLSEGSEAVVRRIEAHVGEFFKHLSSTARTVSESDISNFIASRDLVSQVQMETPSDLLFLHTSPMTLGQRPWAIHVEMLLPMFEPYFGHLRTWDIDLNAQPAYHMIRQMVRHENCRGILTHLKSTRDALPVLFQDQSLASKVFYAPLGIDLSPDIHARAMDAIARKDQKTSADELVLMFTNSWHQMGDNFFKRGGMEVLKALFVLLEKNVKCRLILRTGLPEQLNDDFKQMLRRHPAIELYEQPVPDDKLFSLLERADVFLLPTAGLHTISVLRAMATGAIVISTDVISIEEFIENDVTGYILPGRRGVTYFEDKAKGLLRERSDPLKQIDEKIVASIATTLERLATDIDQRRRIRRAAKAHVVSKHSMGPWRDGFHTMLRLILK